MLKPLGWIATALGLLGVLLTLVTIYDFSKLAAGQNFDSATGPWQNLGSGGWLAAAAFFLLAAGGFEAARAARRSRGADRRHRLPDPSTGRITVRGGALQSLVFVVIAVALFYPPTATSFWQQALVSDIGIYVLLAVGLNVVVGWAGLLDLGYIAFYAIGSYTTAYLSGSLPVKPPSWLHLSPLWAIPFAIGAACVAGVLLGAPTLRLRGDYLAIVTLGFGEIIRIVAVNANGNFTNGPRGVSPSVPHPVLNLGFIRFEWGLNNLQYWYLLLFFVILVVLLFRRLEDSRTGRAWAAIREDEVAAQASGINTTRVKLLAFAIGASTSGLAGVFFASDIGYFNPQNFILNNSILLVAYVVFGGMGSLTGAIAGAAALTWLPEFLRDQVPREDRVMWIGAVLLLMMIFRPEGLIPARRRKAELSGLAGTTQPSTRSCRRFRPTKGCDRMSSRRRRSGRRRRRDLIFDVPHVTLRFGGVTSLDDVSLSMYRGEILAVIGPNGAGKTSLFNSLTGVYLPQEGDVRLSARAGDPPRTVLGQQDPRDQRPRRRTHVPEHPAVSRPHRAGEREGRCRDPAEFRAGLGDARPAVLAP